MPETDDVYWHAGDPALLCVSVPRIGPVTIVNTRGLLSGSDPVRVMGRGVLTDAVTVWGVAVGGWFWGGGGGGGGGGGVTPSSSLPAP
jgi:hypothetical protein